MADKDFKTIDEQIEILRSRGLTIEDEAEAKDFLLRNNYYRVSGYSLTLRKNDVFAKSATFQNIEDIYNFDHEFRHIILHHIETIEVQMKSIYAYEFTKVYGPLGYLDPQMQQCCGWNRTKAGSPAAHRQTDFSMLGSAVGSQFSWKGTADRNPADTGT